MPEIVATSREATRTSRSREVSGLPPSLRADTARVGSTVRLPSIALRIAVASVIAGASFRT